MKDYSNKDHAAANKFPADEQRDSSKNPSHGSKTGMGSDYDRQKQQGGRPASETDRTGNKGSINR